MAHSITVIVLINIGFAEWSCRDYRSLAPAQVIGPVDLIDTTKGVLPL